MHTSSNNKELVIEAMTAKKKELIITYVNRKPFRKREKDCVVSDQFVIPPPKEKNRLT